MYEKTRRKYTREYKDILRAFQNFIIHNKNVSDRSVNDEHDRGNRVIWFTLYSIYVTFYRGTLLR